jgi:hypothetical protein
MNRLTYTIKAYALLAKRIFKGESMPFHSKEMSISDRLKPENKQYLHNGILKTVRMINKGECKLHWLRD